MFYPALTPVEFQESQHPIVRIDAIAKVSRNKVLPTELSGKQVFHYSIPNVQNIGTGKIEDGDTIDSDKWLITEEAVLISKLNPRKSTICLATPQENVTVTSTEFVVLSAGSSIDNRYLKYVLESEIVRQFLTSRTTSATRSHQRVNPHDITALGIPWPEASSRTRTVENLDSELAEIDEFIANQQQLNTILEEKMKAELDFQLWENASNFFSLKRFIKYTDQGISPIADNSPAQIGEYGILKAGCTAGGIFNIEANKKLIPGTTVPDSTFICEGDLLVTRASGSTSVVGSAALVPKIDRNLALSDKIFRLHLKENISPKYLQLIMSSPYFRRQLELEISGAAGLAKNISLSALLNLNLPHIKKEEQEYIENKLTRRVESYKILKECIQKSIDLKKEAMRSKISLWPEINHSQP